MNSSTKEPDHPLPKIAYLGEVPVRNTSAGPVLLYRMLASYPSDRLVLLESDHVEPNPDFDFDQAPREKFHLIPRRWLNSRFSDWVSAWVYWQTKRCGRRLAARLRHHKVEAVLTVTHGYGPLAAEAAASTVGLPLHLLAHDEWGVTLRLPSWLQRRADEAFGDLYRGAATRMPISPSMERHYAETYGAKGDVVYPLRSREAQRLSAPPSRNPQPGNFIFAYAGSAHSVGQRQTLIDFAHATASSGVTLRIYQSWDLEMLRREGLRSDNVEIMAFRPSAQLHQDLIETVDAMYLPMSFTPEDRRNVEICFPSKLADYTVAGLPILVRAPDYGSATEWARHYPEAALLVTSNEPEPLQKAVAKIVNDETVRSMLAWGALKVGDQLFGYDRVSRIFQNQLRRGTPGYA